jgi:hypothetical protein
MIGREGSRWQSTLDAMANINQDSMFRHQIAAANQLPIGEHRPEKVQ